MLHLRSSSFYYKLRNSISIILHFRNQDKQVVPKLSSLAFVKRCSTSGNTYSSIQEPGVKRNVKDLAAFEVENTCSSKQLSDEEVYIISDETVQIYFETRDGQRIECAANVNQRVVDVVLLNNIAMEGNCKGGLSCSTCHVILSEECMSLFPEPSQKESDMLEIVPSVTDNSRLCCQLRITKEMDGIVFKLPYPSYY